MSYPPYTSAYPQPGVPPQTHYGAPAGPVAHGYPPPGFNGGFPGQFPYGGEPGFHAPPPQHDYHTQYAPSYGPGFVAPPAHQHEPSGYGVPQYPQPGQHELGTSTPSYPLGHSGHDAPLHPQHVDPASSYGGTHHQNHRGVPGYGIPPPHNGHGAPTPPADQHGNGTGFGSSAPPPQAGPPAQYTFVQKDGFDRSGSIKDAAGKTLYKLKDASDKHTWTAYLKTRPLNILRADGSKVAVFHWKDDPSEAKLECFAVWGHPGEKGTKVKVMGDVMDANLKFKLPNGRSYGWGQNQTGQIDLLDYQQMQGEGLNVRPKPIARYTPHGEETDATLDVLGEASAVPDLLDAAIITSFQLEYMNNYTS
ncbi:hypothetical protein BXZ70DRAFT_904134 [Cristinia sonorae]|uniref:DUF6593 domain-containing protein n=1 Tax=Cristinia sonorae TaxID=1940300 RepID=A0A8K0UW62_9AGAR|nr:hypothetical protein BXZ70DRAFT_904134 [Cristinia sonorae]